MKECMEEVEKLFFEGLMIDVFIDCSVFIGRIIDMVKNNLIEGVLIVIFVLVIFLGSLCGGFIMAIIILFFLFFVFILMK